MGGDGMYFLAVDKTAAHAETYNIQIHCLAGSDQHTGTTEPALLQDQ